ncbi:2OG-Fe dioxygenase family protein [Methylobacter sp. S3L5C]|nr:2OG-Fe dioxygenase family protein [Methylobacter sp. S3L5C]
MTTLLNEGRIFAEPDTIINRLCSLISRKDRCFIPAERVQQYLSEGSAEPLNDALAFQDSWNDLPCDEYMADGGHYRSRRHATLRGLPSSHIVYIEPHQPHYQSLTYNSLNGNIARYFQPIARKILGGSTMTAILRLCCGIFGRLSPYAH